MLEALGSVDDIYLEMFVAIRKSQLAGRRKQPSFSFGVVWLLIQISTWMTLLKAR
jgi:hypothetical protein